MAGYLIDHAINNVWCSPEQDAQVVLRPARVGPASGTTGRVRINWQDVHVPEPNIKGRYWRLYSLGPLAEHIYNLPHLKQRWVRLDDVCRIQGIYIQLHTVDGLTLPLTFGYMTMLEDETFVLAIRYHRNSPLDKVNKIIDGEDKEVLEDLFVRLYTNTYFSSDEWLSRSDQTLRPLESFSGVVGEGLTPQGFMEEINRIKERNIGVTLIYVNGVYVSRYVPSMGKAGDILSFVHDRSIKRVDTWTVSELHAFQSELDNKEKYVLHPTHYGDMIDYMDDVDFYLYREDKHGRRKGVYYGRFQPDAVRQLTHNVYSLVIHYINTYIQDHPFLDPLGDQDEFDLDSELKIVAFTRHAGYKDRPVVHEVNRIRELYRLDLGRIKAALSGLASLVPEWRAEHLELSAYPKVMGSLVGDINESLISDAYGYNATTRVAYPDLHKTIGEGDNKYVPLPGDFNQATVTSYDQYGVMYGIRNHNGDERVVPEAPIARGHILELQAAPMYHNRGRTFYGHTTVVSPDYLSRIGYRVYVCDYYGDYPNEVWEDVTDDDTYYEVGSDDRTIRWNVSRLSHDGKYPATRLGEHVWVVKSIPWIGSFPGYLEFTLSTENEWCYPTINDSPITTYRPDSVPYGQLEVYMDGLYLIEGLDYYVDYPKVVVVKELPRLPIDGLTITVKQTSFVDPDKGRSTPRDIGWVRGGLVSGNGRWDTRNDRNFKVVVGGRVKTREDVKWSERCDGEPQPDGQPYAIVDTIQPTERLVNLDTVKFRRLATDVDERVQNYFTMIDPGTQPEDDDPIPGLYRLYDPMMGSIIEDLANGWLDGILTNDYSINDIDAWLSDRKWLLEFSPVLRGVDYNFVAVTPHHYPHTVAVTAKQFTFIKRVSDAYYNGRIQLTPYITVEN